MKRGNQSQGMDCSKHISANLMTKKQEGDGLRAGSKARERGECIK